MSETVWIIERDHWPRASLRAELIERGYDAVGFESVSDATAALALPGPSHPTVIVVDLRDQETDAAPLATFLRAGARLVGIGGAMEVAGAVARDIPWSEMLARPVTLGRIADVVGSLVSGPSPRSLPR